MAGNTSDKQTNLQTPTDAGVALSDSPASASVEHTAALSVIRPAAVAIGLPVTVEGLVAWLDAHGARRTAETANLDERALPNDQVYVVASLPERLRDAVAAGADHLRMLARQTRGPGGAERARRLMSVMWGRPQLFSEVAEKVRCLPEDVFDMVTNGDSLTIRVAEEIAARTGADLGWLLGLNAPSGAARH